MKMFGFYGLALPFQGSTYTNSLKPPLALLSREFYSSRKETLHATEKDTPRVQLARVDYWRKIRDVAPENLVFIDETGVNLAMIRLYTRSPLSQCAIGDRPQRRGKNVSLVDALMLGGPISVTTILGSNALEEGIKFAYQQISSEDIHNWFANCCYCTLPN